MKSSELRIGNLYESTDGSGFIKATAKDLYAWESGAIYGKPIQLTEEWFKSAGAEMRSYNAGNSKGFKFKTNKGDLILLYWKVLPHPRCHSFQVFIDTKNIAEIEYVHQLQNLYFALTGEELNFEI